MTLLRRRLLAILPIIVLVIAASLYIMPPLSWSRIKVGMSNEEVTRIIPVFDQPWGDTKADFKYEQRVGFTWRLAVGRDPEGIDMVEKELWITWPEMRRLWHSTTTDTEQSGGGPYEAWQVGSEMRSEFLSHIGWERGEGC